MTALTRHATAQSAVHQLATTAAKKGTSAASVMRPRKKSLVTAAEKWATSRASALTLAPAGVEEAWVADTEGEAEAVRLVRQDRSIRRG